MRKKSSYSSPKFQNVAHLEYQVDPAYTEDDEGALHEGQDGHQDKFQGWNQKLRQRSKGMGRENCSALIKNVYDLQFQLPLLRVYLNNGANILYQFFSYLTKLSL